MRPRVTVLIPLHQSRRFAEVVRRNLAELAPVARLIVSDPFESDPTLQLLENEFGHHPNVSFVGRRALDAGWVPHYNDLLSRVRTPFFMWLAHDDEIDASYLSICLRRLASDRGLGGVVGDITSVEGEGYLDVPPRAYPQSSALGSYRYIANALLFEWNLGILFRGVFRTRTAGPVPFTFGRDQFADIVWAYGYCLDHRIARESSARYRKRFFPDSTHRQWNLALLWSGSLPHLAGQIERSNLSRKDRSACRNELLRGLSSRIVAQLSAPTTRDTTGGN